MSVPTALASFLTMGWQIVLVEQGELRQRVGGEGFRVVSYEDICEVFVGDVEELLAVELGDDELVRREARVRRMISRLPFCGINGGVVRK